MKTLHLTLKKKWFDMILLQLTNPELAKKEEYREIKPYWAKRLLYKIEFPWGGYMSAWKDIVNGDYECRGWQNTTGQAPIWENFDTITFRNGYSSNAPEMAVKFRGLYIGTGKTNWGAEDGKKYFVIQLGEIISTKNVHYENS